MHYPCSRIPLPLFTPTSNRQCALRRGRTAVSLRTFFP